MKNILRLTVRYCIKLRSSLKRCNKKNAVAGAAAAQKPSPKDIVSRVFSKINENKHGLKEDKSSVSDIEMYIQELRHKRKKRELEHQMELLEIDAEVAKYERILEQLKKEM